MKLGLRVAFACGLIAVTSSVGGYELTNGSYSAPWPQCPFIQSGGTASVSMVGFPCGITVNDGVFFSGNIDWTWHQARASFTQNGGLHVNSNGIVLASSIYRHNNRFSSYTMNGGVLRTPSFTLAGRSDGGGSYRQTGGTNIAGAFAINVGGAQIEEGALCTSILSVSGVLSESRPGGSTLAHRGSFQQLGGRVRAGTFAISSGGYASVQNGTLIASNLTLSGVVEYPLPGCPCWVRGVPSLFEQRDGNILIREFIINTGATGYVQGGSLIVSNLTLSGSGQYGHIGSSIGIVSVDSSLQQGGGNIAVHRRLAIGSSYFFTGGSLNAKTISVAGRMTIDSPAITNSERFILRGGTLETSVPCRLGHLVLRTNTSIFSALVFRGAGAVQFLNGNGSGSSAWSPRAYLVVKNWHGTLTGGGANQFRVGASKAGLSREQLQRIIFENPSNLPPGDYTARILQTGKVVPNAPIQIGLRSQRNRTVLTWSEPYHLETATNLASQSQWLTVTEASPLTIRFSDPQRYFRLRR